MIGKSQFAYFRRQSRRPTPSGPVLAAVLAILSLGVLATAPVCSAGLALGATHLWSPAISYTLIPARSNVGGLERPTDLSLRFSSPDTRPQEREPTHWRVADPGTDRWLAVDKFKHVGVSAVLTVAFWGMLREVGMSQPIREQWAAGATLSIGLFKEVAYDAGRSSGASWKDFVADIIGVGVGLLIVDTLDP